MNGKNTKEKQGKIDSLQALRALAFVGIFLSHAGFIVNWPELGVSVFFVMSGYLMVYAYENRDFEVTIKNNFYFAISKIKKLYPLHILTMLCMTVLSLAVMASDGFTISSLIDLAVKFFLNLTLMQTWIPYKSVNLSLNGVAWYLSVTLFLYFIFPYVLRWINNKSKKTLSIICAAILLIQMIACVPIIYIFGKGSPIYYWFMYCFPVFRLGDFFVGCCLGKLPIGKKANGDLIIGNKYSVYELLALALTVGICMWLKHNYENIFLLVSHNKTTLYIPLAVIWIYLFVVNRGVFTKLFSNRMLIYLGNISAYIFLIHYVIIQYISHLFNFLDINVQGWLKIRIILVELTLSIIVSVVYMRLEGSIKTSIHRKVKTEPINFERAC